MISGLLEGAVKELDIPPELHRSAERAYHSVGGWLAEVAAVAQGAFDPAMARLGLAVTRGLLLDLVATDDDAGVDAAANAFIQLLSRRP